MDPQPPINQGTPATTPAALPPTQASQPASKGTGLLSPSNLFHRGESENLISPITIIGMGGPVGLWKSIFLDVITILFAAGFGYAFSKYLAGSISFWVVLIPLLLWAAASVLEAFLQQKIGRRFLIVLLESFALIAFFYNYTWQALAVTVVVVLFFLLWGYFSLRRNVRNSLDIHFFAASKRTAGKVVTVSIIFMIVMYASLASSRGGFFVSENAFNIFFAWASGIANNYYPTVSLNGSFGDFAQSVAQLQLQGSPAFENLTPAEQSSTLVASAAQLMSEFSSATTTAVATTTAPSNLSYHLAPSTVATSTPGVSPVVSLAEEPTNQAFYNYVAGVAAGLQERYNDLFVGAWCLALFLILRSIGIIVVWIAQFVTLLFYELFLATGFMRIKEETATKEVVEFN